MLSDWIGHAAVAGPTSLSQASVRLAEYYELAKSLNWNDPLSCWKDVTQEHEIMQRFGFLYGGYSFQYWETVDMMRKLVIGGIPVFIAVQSLGSLQAVVGEVRVACILCITLHIKL